MIIIRALHRSALRALAAGLILSLAVLSRSAAQAPAAPTLPSDLALVPADGLGFVHVRLAELWQHSWFAPFRETLAKAGPKVLAALDEQFVPKLSAFDRITGFLMVNPVNPRAEPFPMLVIRFREAVSAEAIVKAHMPEAKKHLQKGVTLYVSDGLGVCFPDDRHALVGPALAILHHLERQRPASGPLSSALALAASKPIVLSLAPQRLPMSERDREAMPPELWSLIQAENITVLLDLGQELSLQVQAEYGTGRAAEAAQKGLDVLAQQMRPLVQEQRDQLERQLLRNKGPLALDEWPEALGLAFAIGFCNRMDELLADSATWAKRDGSRLTARFSIGGEIGPAMMPAALTVAGLLIPAVQKVRTAAARTASANNMKQLAIAIHNYISTTGHFPQDIVDRDGKPLLSWRVRLLPYLEQAPLYEQFKLDEPWDCPHNRKVSQQALSIFVSPHATQPVPAGFTNYQAFVGPGAIFEPGKKFTLADVTDGTSYTLLLVETGELVEWAKPGGIPFDPKKPIAVPASPRGDDTIAIAMVDGSVRILKRSVLEKILKALITRNGGEVINFDDSP